MSLNSSLKFQLFRVRIPYFSYFRFPVPYFSTLHGSVPYIKSCPVSRHYPLEVILMRSYLNSAILLYRVMNSYFLPAGVKELIEPKVNSTIILNICMFRLVSHVISFRVVPYFFPSLEMIQGWHPLLFQKSSGLSHVTPMPYILN